MFHSSHVFTMSRKITLNKATFAVVSFIICVICCNIIYGLWMGFCRFIFLFICLFFILFRISSFFFVVVVKLRSRDELNAVLLSAPLPTLLLFLYMGRVETGC